MLKKVHIDSKVIRIFVIERAKYNIKCYIKMLLEVSNTNKTKQNMISQNMTIVLKV